MFFHAYMYGPMQGKRRLYAARNVHFTGAISPSDWEVFGSILVKDHGKKLAAGIDLMNNEVKSATNQGSYEYQYHKNSGRDKLAHDRRVGHLFFDHANHLRLVNLRWMHGSQLTGFFDAWHAGFPQPYKQ